ncbi:hypothetical protein ABEO98_21590 [Brevibacillus parabrevis]|uniref:hypothetical protein n=1 Tax=Brevibacillus parabrevis TaxID=54914 RepID=UPI002E219CD7|nr:hypothetical protein [Brevibacillus parabrevis]
MGSNGLDLTTSVGFGAMDLFTTAMSLIMNFKEFLIFGLAFVVGPWLIGIIVKAVKAAQSKKATA